MRVSRGVRSGPGRRAGRSWRGGWLCLLLAVSLLAPAAPPARGAAGGTAALEPAPRPLPTTMLLGIAGHAWWFDAYREETLAAYRDLHVQVVRIGVDWKRVEATPGVYDWSLYDRLLPTLAERRIAIVANLNTIPAWASHDPLCAVPTEEPAHCFPKKEHAGDWERFAAAAAARYPFIERWEIWNEPEIWAGIGDVHQYLDYVFRAHRAIKAALPQARVAISSLAGWDWIGWVYANTSPEQRVWEAIAYHPYPIPGGSPDSSQAPIDTVRIERIRAGLIEQGHPDMPLWITEFGFSKDPQEQAVRLRAALSWFAGRTDIELLCLHQLHDWSGDDPAPAGFGLLRAAPRPTEQNPPPTRFTPKTPFYETFRDYPRVAPPPPPDSPARRSFAPTGQTVADPFLAYWDARGGLPIYGFPISDLFWERLEDGRWYRVQYFERARFEHHPENRAPYDVLLGQFGRRIRPADPPAPPRAGGATGAPAAYFPETGHNLGGPFLAYWQARGGLPQFGFPISEEFEEQLEDGRVYRVQYFERARFEHHPEYAAPNDVLLGHFGRRILGELPR